LGGGSSSGMSVNDGGYFKDRRFPQFQYLPSEGMSLMRIWDLDSWTKDLSEESYIHDMYDGLYPMLSQNLHACRVNKMLKFDFDDEDIMAITYSTWPWSDQHVKQMVFDLDIFQLPTTTRQLLIMLPPDSYTETKKGLKLLDGMTLSQKGNACNDAIIRHLDQKSLNIFVRQPIIRALKTLAKLKTENVYNMYDKEEMQHVYQNIAVESYTAKSVAKKTKKELAILGESYLNEVKLSLMRNIREFHQPPNKRTRIEDGTDANKLQKEDVT
jgi:hypothetical protein